MTIEIVTRREAMALGLKRYFTGKPCPHGHIAERFLSSGTCVTCVRERFDRWCKADPEKAAAKQRRWRAANLDHCRERDHAWEVANREKRRAEDRRRIAANREAHNAKGRAWREANPEKHQAYLRKSYEKNRAKRNASTRAWLLANPDKRGAGQALYKARKLRAAPSWLTREQLIEIDAIYHRAYEAGLSVDHAVPLAGCMDCGAHGLHVPWNLEIVPLATNKAKHARCPSCFEP